MNGILVAVTCALLAVLGGCDTRIGLIPAAPHNIGFDSGTIEEDGSGHCGGGPGWDNCSYLRRYRPASASATDPGLESHWPSTNEVPLERNGGVYMVPVIINKAVRIKFVIDSGASNVTIPVDVALTLMRSGTLSGSDFIGNHIYKLADGRTLKSLSFVLREVQVGNTVIRNITANVNPVESEPLLGQSFLSKLGSVTLDNDRHVLVLGSAP